MIVVREAADHDRDAWEGFISRNAPPHHGFRFAWRQIISSVFGHTPRYLIATRNGGAICGVVPHFEVKSLLFGRSLISVPYVNAGGIVAEDPETFRALLERSREMARDAKYLELRNRSADPNAVNIPSRTHKVAMQLVLDSDPEKLFGTFPGKLRSQIRRPAKSGVYAEVTDATADALSKFYQVFAENMRDLGTPVYPKALFERCAALFSDRMKVVNVFRNRDAVAAGILLGDRGVIEIPWASSLRRFNNLSANMLLYWEAIKFSCLAGYDIFDFGRSTRDSGTYRFKEQWGAKPIELCWYYANENGKIPDVNPSDRKYVLLVNTWQKLPIPLTKLIGPWLTRSLP